MNDMFEKYNKWKENIFESMDSSVWKKQSFTEEEIKETNKYFLNETNNNLQEEPSLREENFKKRKIFASQEKESTEEEESSFSFSYPSLTMLSFEADEFFQFESNSCAREYDVDLFDSKKIPSITMEEFSSDPSSFSKEDKIIEVNQVRNTMNKNADSDSDDMKKKIQASSIIHFFRVFLVQTQFLFSIANIHNNIHRIYTELFPDMGNQFSKTAIHTVDNILRLKNIKKAEMLYDYFEEKYALSSRVYVLQLKGGFLPKKVDHATQKIFIFVPFIFFKKNCKKTRSDYMIPYNLYRNYIILEQENFEKSFKKHFNKRRFVPNITNETLMSSFISLFKDYFICNFDINKAKGVQFFDHFLLPIPNPNTNTNTPIQYLPIYDIFPWFIYRSHVMKKNTE